MTRKEAIEQLGKLLFVNHKEEEAAALAIRALYLWDQWKWHDCILPENGDFPDDDRMVLCSFVNFSLPMLGRWQDGAWYQGDLDETFVQDDLFVDGWWALPEKPEVSDE